MKTSRSLLILACSIASVAGALAAESNSVVSVSSESGASTNYAVVERGPNHRVWRKTTCETGPDGKTNRVGHKYTELGTGLNYRKPGGGWAETEEEFELLPDGKGAIAARGRTGFACRRACSTA